MEKTIKDNYDLWSHMDMKSVLHIIRILRHWDEINRIQMELYSRMEEYGLFSKKLI